MSATAKQSPKQRRRAAYSQVGRSLPVDFHTRKRAPRIVYDCVIRFGSVHITMEPRSLAAVRARLAHEVEFAGRQPDAIEIRRREFWDLYPGVVILSRGDLTYRAERADHDTYSPAAIIALTDSGSSFAAHIAAE